MEQKPEVGITYRARVRGLSWGGSASETTYRFNYCPGISEVIKGAGDFQRVDQVTIYRVIPERYEKVLTWKEGKPK